MKKERLNKYIDCSEDYLIQVGTTKISKRKLLKHLLSIRKCISEKDELADAKIDNMAITIVDNIASHIQDAEFDVE